VLELPELGDEPDKLDEVDIVDSELDRDDCPIEDDINSPPVILSIIITALFFNSLVTSKSGPGRVKTISAATPVVVPNTFCPVDTRI
jgi:hypothetical protein